MEWKMLEREEEESEGDAEKSCGSKKIKTEDRNVRKKFKPSR